LKVFPIAALLFSAATVMWCQHTDVQRTFPVPAEKVKTAITRLPGGISGHLPLLEGFIKDNGIALDRYRRAFYQCSVTVDPQGSTAVVRVIAKISAWNSDPAHPGYEKLQSNGRIEADFLDRLQDVLAADAAVTPAKNEGVKLPSAAKKEAPEVAAPVQQLPSIRALSKAPHDLEPANSPPGNPAVQEQLRSVQDLLQNQSHPSNLVAVKKDDTPVLQNPRTDATVLFLASAQDEFEILSASSDWVYVRISGLSRGWIRKSNLELMEDSAAEIPSRANAAGVPLPADHSTQVQSEVFSISTEMTGSFPGDWEPLKGKSVRIISVQPADAARASDPEEKLRFTESIFSAHGTAQTSHADGLVVIFDSQDGGMVAATGPSIEAWKSGSISGTAFWKTCYFDPPGILGQQ